ncbi:uncharacterized protein MONOS_9166 [Monocercomonoides exilis]|uniref:uncharacterized protein n=1 Tax=Monocercomonoides exilis TaxID=2049356 RepID=UPI00355A9CA6|nr:hypothetical protein MONOS_9166 [Monocercomonoides exilis]|eukprot:MONOS_9166.1-p1 / transcript=MONOS_9166.1 / gene=MONOS_9166 / organism=Monocercomonoides_exilis_PA203 / gene_product=unspecified product / transcript_product=unspecified product / location=Mono_scaffold00369:39664-41097(+) / protein_length=478 / sequence_SO=supercontig / SO=protein_coding / is_pseudo=false
MFIGLRSGSNIISDYCVVHGEDKIIDSTRQPNATIESFIYNTIKPKTEKDNRKHIHSLYDNVHKYDNSACGVYVPITQIKAGSYLDIDIPISIPLDDILLFSGFIDYPNRLFGNLKLKFTIKPEALVYCRVSPKMSMIKTVGKRRNYFKSSQGQNYDSIMKMILTTPDSCFEYAKKFTQINCPSRQFVFNYDLTAEGTVDGFNYETIIPEFTPTVTFCQTKDCEISIAGYSVSSQCLTNLVEYFSSHPFVVPSQRIETKRLGSAPTPSGFQQCHDNLCFNHVMSTVTQFQKDTRHWTSFDNPQYKELQLYIGDRRFPEKPLNTTDATFFQMMLNASDLDSLFPATEEYEESLTSVKNNASEVFFPTTDDTSFMFTTQCERSGGTGICFDGIHTGNTPVSVELRGTPIYSGETDTYYNVRDDLTQNARHPPAPLFNMVQQSFWIFSLKDGLNVQYVKDHTAEDVLRALGYTPTGELEE